MKPPKKNRFVPERPFDIVAKSRKKKNDPPEMIVLEKPEAEEEKKEGFEKFTAHSNTCVSKGPSKILLTCEKKPYLLYHLTDHVYLRPKTVINILLRIR